MNRIILAGRITRTPEMRYTNEGTSVLNFSIAVNGYNERVDFFNITAFGKRAETISQYFDKGDQIMLEGRAQIDNYEDREGNKRSSFSVVLDNFDFGAKAGGGDNAGRQQKPKNTRRKPVEEEVDNFTDEDLPF